MDVPTFLLGLLKEQTAFMSAVAWPLAVVGIAFLFRKEVRVLLSRVAAIRSPFADVELKEELAQTQVAVATAVVESAAELQITRPPDLGGQEAVQPGINQDDVDEGVEQRDSQPIVDLVKSQLGEQRWTPSFAYRGAKGKVGTVVARSWIPIERLIADMMVFVSGMPTGGTGMTTSARARRLSAVGAITKADADAVTELEDLSGRMLLARGDQDSSVALDKFELMATSLRKVLINRWLRLKSSQSEPMPQDSSGS